jgi:hypothetical protein
LQRRNWKSLPQNPRAQKKQYRKASPGDPHWPIPPAQSLHPQSGREDHHVVRAYCTLQASCPRGVVDLGDRTIAAALGEADLLDVGVSSESCAFLPPFLRPKKERERESPTVNDSNPTAKANWIEMSESSLMKKHIEPGNKRHHSQDTDPSSLRQGLSHCLRGTWFCQEGIDIRDHQPWGPCEWPIKNGGFTMVHCYCNYQKLGFGSWSR